MSSINELMKINVAELFAGVGGFREAMQATNLRSHFRVTWSNQWEPAESKKPGNQQSANKVYIEKFGSDGHFTDDIHLITESSKSLPPKLLDIQMLVGGFPCQDYSVAKPKNVSKGIRGPKGVLWWSIEKILRDARPDYFLLENVDRLINSPALNRGRDFAVILKGLEELGYIVEWRIINAADYGFVQKRRRIFIFGYQEKSKLYSSTFKNSPKPADIISKAGVLAKALPCEVTDAPKSYDIGKKITSDDKVLSQYKSDGGVSHFGPAGILIKGVAWSCRVGPISKIKEQALKTVLLNPLKNKQDKLPDNSQSFFIPSDSLTAWSYAKGRKNEPRRKTQPIAAFIKNQFGLSESETRKIYKDVIKILKMDFTFDFPYKGQAVPITIAREEVNHRVLSAYGKLFSTNRPNELNRKTYIDPLIAKSCDKIIWNKTVDGVLSIALDRAVSLLSIKDKTTYSGIATLLRPLVENAILNLIKDNPRYEMTVKGKIKSITRDQLSDKSFAYGYKEGGLPFPDPVDRAGRTIITSEGGASVSRFKHAICDVCGSGNKIHKTSNDCIKSGRIRRLYPVELERMNGFSDHHSNVCKKLKISDGKRAFFMGNALVVGVVQKILTSIIKRI